MNKRRYIKYLPIYGSFSTGMIYLGIGVIAILSFLKIKDGGADESSLLAFLNQSFFGKILFWVILLGTICYIIWRIFECITDPYQYGKDAKGLAKRTGIAMSTIPDALIAFSAVQILFGRGNVQIDGQPLEQRQMVGALLQEHWGDWVVISTGVLICLTALVQFFYGITRGYKERVEMAHFSIFRKRVTHFLAWAGYLARGVIVGIMGFSFLRAGTENSAVHIVNTDKAFDYIGDHIGHVYFILVAVGTICYGLFMFVHGVAHDADKD
jgi:hypothetical protein